MTILQQYLFRMCPFYLPASLKGCFHSMFSQTEHFSWRQTQNPNRAHRIILKGDQKYHEKSETEKSPKILFRRELHISLISGRTQDCHKILKWTRCSNLLRGFLLLGWFVCFSLLSNVIKYCAIFKGIKRNLRK